MTDAEFFDELASKIDSAANQIRPQCGLIYELYQRRLSEEIEKIIAPVPDKFIDMVLEFVREDYEYLSPREREEQIKMGLDEGLCSHGLSPDYCPLGCGDLD